MTKKIIFVSGTRADFGKIKSLIAKLMMDRKFKIYIVVTGMHLLTRYGHTITEISNAFPNLKIISFNNQSYNDSMDIILSKTINKISKIFKKIKPDLIFVHGDRVEALGSAIAGSFNNFPVAHIEGGEVSGTIDEHIRHSLTKLSHLHFVSNYVAKRRLLQLGEKEKNIYIIGSPDVDIIKSEKYPIISQVKKRYKIKFEKYGIIIFHPVTTETKNVLKNYVSEIIKFIIQSKDNFIIIYPNNDSGSEIIINEYNKKLKKNEKVRIIRSMRFEYFLSLLENSNCIIGNSSCGVREAPYFGVPTINIGKRQKNRINFKSIKNCNGKMNNIFSLFKKFNGKKFPRADLFGRGNSAPQILRILKNKNIWKVSLQKHLIDRF